MAIQSASAKLYTGIRCWVVDKNISANLVSYFHMGNANAAAGRQTYIGGQEVFNANPPDAIVQRLVRVVADLVMTPSMSITNQRLKTFGGGNVINDGHFVPGQTYKIVSVGNTDWNAIAGTTGETYVVGSEFIAINNGTLPSVSPASFTPDDKRNPTAKTGKAGLSSWTLRSSVVCKFPTYFRIDVDKLQLPQGTTCTVSFEEDWIRDGVYLESTRASSPAIGNFFTFRTPWLGASFINSSFSLPGNFLYRTRPASMSVNSAFTPVMSAKITRRGVIDLQFAFTAVIIAGEVVRLLSRADLFVVAGPMGPGSTPYLEGNGYGIGTGLSFWPQGFPGILRIRQDSAVIVNASTASLSAEVYNLPYIVPAVNYSSEFTVSANCDAFKGVGTPHLQASSSMTVTSRVDYNSTVPTLQANATVFCRTPQQANATLVAQSSVTADIGQALELEWVTQSANETIGIVFKGPNIDITLKWSDGLIQTINGGTYNPDIADAPISVYHTRTVSTAGNIYVRIYGSLSGFQMSRNGVDYINGLINSDDSYLGPAPTYAVAGRNRLRACNGWGDLGITNLMGAFANCTSLDTVPNFLPKNVLNTACMFLNCVNMNDPAVLTWNTSTITSMAGMFRQASQFNQPIGVWDTGNVVYMSRMFRGGNASNYPVTIRDSSFNQSLNGWDVTNVSRTNMTEMFYFNELMAGNCNQWCVSHIATVPPNFASSSTTTWPTANRPIWGTCP